ncbi:serine/threonine protein kinase, partial [Pseudomonas aeruginosa]|nr:serine/threonine protein kinase [Pseudomonas aeruginosa]MBF3016858.1 serine/threonine protein kinase [Pseudomonas aeruginosa]MBF3186152.1 serine/threonine protein kinase [Pseudomonas aeruginosa]
PGHLPRRCWPALRTALSLDPERRCIGVRELQEALGARRSWLAGVLAR